MESPFTWGGGGVQMTPERIAAQRKIAEALLAQGSDTSPVKHWTQGAARVAQTLLGSYDNYAANKAESANRAADQDTITDLLSGGAASSGAPVAAAPAVAPEVSPASVPTRTAGDPASAIAAIESGGKYDILGPVTKTGDRAYGKYQVMGANVPAWTKAHLGQEMTPDQFLANPQAQDAVFKGQFGQYSNKYGPEGAARAWFAGEGGMNDMGRKDQLGTSVAAYASKFNRGMGGQSAPQQSISAQPRPDSAVPAGSPVAAAPTQVAQAAPAAAGGVQGVNPALLKAITSPYAGEGVKKIAGLLLQHQLQGDAVTTVDLGNEVGVMDKRGNIIRRMPKGEPNKGPEFKEVENPDGTKGYIWANPKDQSTKPVAIGQQNTAPSSIPPAPPGVDAKIWRETFSKGAAKDAQPAEFDNITKVRHEFSQLPSYKNMSQAAPIYQSMADAAGRNTKAADLNMVYGLGKIMDPGSVVREGEIQMANNAQGWQEKLNGIVAQINNQGGLTPEGRKALMAEAYSRITSYKQMFDQDAKMYTGIAERNRMNVADVIQSFGEFKPWEPAAAPPAATVAPAPAKVRRFNPATGMIE